MGARLGMLVVETIAKIRRAYFAQKKPIKAICREFRVSRKVVRKVIRSEATEFRYERGRQPLPKIGPWRAEIDALLLANEGKPARERLTLIRIFEELRALGYGGSYDAVRRYAKAWRVARGALLFATGTSLSRRPSGVPFACRSGVPIACRLTAIGAGASAPSPWTSPGYALAVKIVMDRIVISGDLAAVAKARLSANTAGTDGADAAASRLLAWQTRAKGPFP